MGVHGMTERAGFTTPNLLEADTNRAFVEASQRLIVVADHSKWNTVGLASIAPLAAADTVVTDDALDRRAIETLRAHVDDVIVCSAVTACPDWPHRRRPGGDRSRAPADGARARPYDDVDAAIAGSPSPWVRSLDGTVAVPPPSLAGRRRRPADVGADSRRPAGTRSPFPAAGCCRRTAATTAARRSTSTCGCPSPARRRTFRPTTRPASTGASSRSRAPWRRRRTLLRVGSANSMGFVWVNGCVRRVRHRQPPAVDVRHHRRTSAAARTRCASSCRGGARRRGSRTRTSGGCPACTAASSWCRCRRIALGDTATFPAWKPTARPARSTSTSVSTSAPVGARTADRRGRRHRSARPAPRARSPRRGASTCPAGRLAMKATSTPSPTPGPGHRVIDRLRVPGIEAWNHEQPAALPRRHHPARRRRRRCSMCGLAGSGSGASSSPTAPCSSTACRW